MKYEYIETFLAVLDYGSIAKAAEALYISQGTASTRIKLLEEELQITLFYRQKGQRRIELTTKGEAFLPIAQQWLALWQDALSLKNQPHLNELKIGSVDMINLYTLTPLYDYIITTYPHLKLVIKTHHSSELYKLVDNQVLDIAIGVNVYPYSNIESTPLYEENFVLLCHKNHPYLKSKKIIDLNDSDEIYQHFSNEFEIWHQHYFKNRNHRLITIGTTSMQEKFLTNEKRWTILPESVGKAFIRKHEDFVITEMSSQPPKRTVHLLTYKYPRPGVKEATEIFVRELLNYLGTSSSFNILYHKN